MKKKGKKYRQSIIERRILEKVKRDGIPYKFLGTGKGGIIIKEEK